LAWMSVSREEAVNELLLVQAQRPQNSLEKDVGSESGPDHILSGCEAFPASLEPQEEGEPHTFDWEKLSAVEY